MNSVIRILAAHITHEHPSLGIISFEPLSNLDGETGYELVLRHVVGGEEDDVLFGDVAG
jgi:hypothetical protein